MKMYHISNTELHVSSIAYGCMNIGGSWNDEPITLANRAVAMKVLHAALDSGINFFDHADIYCRGKSEQIFSDLWIDTPSLRQRILIQSKCGIRSTGDPKPDSPGRYDFSYTHIVASVEGILKRLKTDYLDVLLLHRPDPLVEPEDVANAFDHLFESGKVRYFGVSNHTAGQIALLQKYLRQNIIFNQVEYNLIHHNLLNEGIEFNRNHNLPTRNEGTIEYCRTNNITIQAWSPLAKGRVAGHITDKPGKSLSGTALLVAEMAKEKKVSTEAVLIAWILRHPMKIQPIIGTTNPQRIRGACESEKLDLTREEWYRLFIAARGENMP